MPSLRRNGSLERVPDNEKKSNTMVYLNVYDLTPANNYLYMFGVGVFHSGVEGLSASSLYSVHDKFLIVFGLVRELCFVFIGM